MMMELFRPVSIELKSAVRPRRPEKEFPVQANQHTMSNLFAQLGLSAEPAAIEEFIAAHRPLGNGTALYRAPFWSASQRTFLKEEIIEDADWAGVIDELNSRLS